MGRVIVVAETNFLLHMALHQEQAAAAESLLCRVESGDIQIGIPIVCVSEATSLVIYRRVERRRVSNGLEALIGQLGQSAQHVRVSEAVREVSKSVAETGTTDVESAWGVFQRVLKIAQLIPLDARAWSVAVAARSEFNLEIGDALVVGSVVSYLETARPDESIFVSTDSEAFDTPSVKQRLGALGCRYMRQFAHVEAFLDSRRASSE